MSMYATRDAALNWYENCRNHLVGLGFKQGKANPCLFRRQVGNLKVFVHGDGYVASGAEDSWEWMASDMSKQYECKMHTLGPDKTGGKQL